MADGKGHGPVSGLFLMEEFFRVWCERCLGRLVRLNERRFCGTCGALYEA